MSLVPNFLVLFLLPHEQEYRCTVGDCRCGTMRTVSLGVAQDLGCSSLTLDWTLELAPGGASHAIMKEKRGRHVGFLDQESVLLCKYTLPHVC